MTNCTSKSIKFPGCKGKKVEGIFGSQSITSDGGVCLLSAADRALDLITRIARGFEDSRRRASCRHTLKNLLKQRVYALALGYEDLNDHDELRNDPAIQTAVGRDTELASASTLCRFENRIDKEALWVISRVLTDVFIESYKEEPQEIVLDFDSTDDRVHGNQEGRFFHGYYDHYCFLPLYVFCGEHLLTAYLRPSNIDNAKHSLAILGLLVKRIRETWPNVRIIFRGDSGFCRWRSMQWCDSHKIDYILGFAKNSRVGAMAEPFTLEARRLYIETGEKQKLFGEVSYAAKSWDKERRIIVKAEHMDRGSNPRYVVTSLKGEPGELYQKYCARGEMENRIKEQQLCLFSDRTSCSEWLPNQFRVLLSALGYTLLNAIRNLGLHGTLMDRARCDTIRLKLLKIGAAVVPNTRRIKFLLSNSCPYQALFRLAASRLCPG